MILIAKENITIGDLKKKLKNHKYMLPEKKEHYSGTVVFMRGKPYRLKQKESVGVIKCELGVFFIYAEGDGSNAPEDLFRIFRK